MFRVFVNNKKSFWVAKLNRIPAYYHSHGFVQTVKKIASKLKRYISINFSVSRGNTELFNSIRHAIDDKHTEYRDYKEYSSCDQVIKYIAFYLPQFHPVPENNLWWGAGFTEWTNVTRALPQYVGHHQPRLPGELGFYDLRLREVRLRQIELAKNYGLHGFCYHYYWFSGKKLLDYPINALLEDKTLDFPFCINWANENWTRTWDGLESDVLMEQSYSDGDYLAFIKDVSIYLQDERYIKVQGKPLLMVYRPSLIPDINRMVDIWRNYCHDIGLGEIYLVLTHSFDSLVPEDIGFDAAVEFSPNNMPLKAVDHKIDYINPAFSGNIYSYKSAIELAKKYIAPQYTKFRTVCPSWDNEARKTGKGGILDGAKPSLYKEWLDVVSQQAINDNDIDNRFVFINAWNEWAEGAYLEPDQRFGYAYLEATRKSLNDTASRITGRRIVLVSHDAHPHGAQYLILNIAKILNESMGFIIDMIVLGDGPLIEEYNKYATVHMLAGYGLQSAKVDNLLSELNKQGVKSAITNTTVTGLFVPVLKRHGFNVISLIHELPQLIKDFGLQKHVDAIAKNSDKVVFAATSVHSGFESFSELDKDKVVLRAQGLYKKNALQSSEKIRTARLELRKRYALPEEAKIILGVGFADYRKGIDIFIESGVEMLQKGKEVYFLWLGEFEPRIEIKIKRIIKKSGFNDYFIFPGLDYDTDVYYAGADIFALTSREDPFPSVVMESLDVLTPVVAFANSGGSAELLSKGGGVLVDEMGSKAFSSCLTDLIDNPGKLDQLGHEGKRIVDEDFSFRSYLFDLLEMAGINFHRVSVVVPNYNYEKYINERLQSIINQTYPVFEIVVLDDASTDNSVEVIREVLESQLIEYKVIVNEENSGSAFSQWKKGVDAATGEKVWIAEADDSSSSEFLNEVLQGFEDPDVVLSYCESKQVDEAGHEMADNYLEYVADVDGRHWLSPFVIDGNEEIVNALSVKNTIPNVSGVVFDKNSLKAVLEKNIDQIQTYRVAGDWLVYVLILRGRKIAFSPLSLNLHRRHRQGITIGNFCELQLNEIETMQAYIAENFDVSKGKIDMAEKYLDILVKQFGLVPKKNAGKVS